MPPALLVLLLLVIGQPVAAAETRTSFLALLERPRVPLAAETAGVMI